MAELVGTDHARIVRQGLAALARGADRAPPPNPYGDGRAGERIADIVLADLAGTPRRTEDWQA